MSFTKVWKEFPAETFEDAAAAMLHDPSIFDFVPLDPPEHGDQGDAAGAYRGYSVVAWEWTAGVLKVWFR